MAGLEMVLEVMKGMEGGERTTYEEVERWRRWYETVGRQYEEVGWGYKEVGWKYEGNNKTRTPALGKNHPGSPEMKHFCWGNCLASFHRMTTSNLGCWSPLLTVQIWRSHFQMGAKVVS